MDVDVNKSQKINFFSFKAPFETIFFFFFIFEYVMQETFN